MGGGHNDSGTWTLEHNTAALLHFRSCYPAVSEAYLTFLDACFLFYNLVLYIKKNVVECLLILGIHMYFAVYAMFTSSYVMQKFYLFFQGWSQITGYASPQSFFFNIIIISSSSIRLNSIVIFHISNNILVVASEI